MIDFRYHLVSLASVLIALAIGIVLGAGPLKEGIGESLGQQVSSLRQEKDQLRTELDAATAENNGHAAFERAALADLVADRLSGHSVAVVTLPGAASGLVSNIEDTLGAAGAELAGPAQIEQAWTDPASDAVQERAALAGELAPKLGLTPAEDGSVSLDEVLAAVLTNRRPAAGEQPGQPAPSESERSEAWSRLREAKLVGGSFPDTAASLVVVVGAPQIAVPAQTATTDADPLAGLARLALALDRGSDGAVIAAEVDPTVANAESVVSAARSESQVRQRVSSVDNAGSAMGQASIVFALAEQDTGGAGQYGRLTGAGALFPDVS